MLSMLYALTVLHGSQGYVPPPVRVIVPPYISAIFAAAFVAVAAGWVLAVRTLPPAPVYDASKLVGKMREGKEAAEGKEKQEEGDKGKDGEQAAADDGVRKRRAAQTAAGTE